MTIEQKVGQLMIWTFNGTEISPEIQQTLTKYQPGAFVVFRRNIKSPLHIAKLISEMQRLLALRKAPPLFLMVDQEGGLVTRVHTTTPMPSALALAKMEDPEFVEKYARTTGQLLQLLGFNVDLAPVLDISNPKLDSFIGNRTFGDDPETVSELTAAYSQGISNSGLLPTAKHFPGHGGTMTDSHQSTPRKMSTLEELQVRDLVPFANFTSATYPRAIMMAHLALPNVDSSGLPATYSTTIIKDRLRQALGYNGLVITDDLEMNGASISKDIGERAVRAFLAGNDMLMVAGSTNHQHIAYEAVLRAVKSGRISRTRLDSSVARILAAKSALPKPPKLDEGRIAGAFKALEVLSKEVMKHNFKVAADEAAGKLPAVKTETHIVVFSANYRFFKNFESAFRGRATGTILTPDTLNVVGNSINSMHADFAVFFASGSKTAHWLNQLEPGQKAKLVVVNCNNPGEIIDQNAYMAVLNINSYFPESAAWLARLLNDNATPDNRTPAGDEDSP